jgi:hypothetical protein
MDLRGIRWDGVDCMDLSQDRDQWRYLLDADLLLVLEKGSVSQSARAVLEKQYKYNCINRLSALKLVVF